MTVSALTSRTTPAMRLRAEKREPVATMGGPPRRRSISASGTIRRFVTSRTHWMRPARSHRRRVSMLIPSARAASLPFSSRSRDFRAVGMAAYGMPGLSLSASPESGRISGRYLRIWQSSAELTGRPLMKGFALEAFGQQGAVTDLPEPSPGEGQIRIRVAAAGLNPFDNAVMQGYMKDHMEHRFPLVPGMDASGTVDAVGAGVTDWAVGDDAFGSVGKSYFGEGTLAEFTTMSTATVGHKLAALEHTAAAAIPVAGVTALNMVDALLPRDGDIVVAFGATGGVGSYFVQLATRLGAR